MNTCLLLIGDGREDYRERTLESAKANLPKFNEIVEIDDTDHRLGFRGAVAEGWRQCLDTGADYIFHLELDFTFRRPVPVRDMIRVLKARPYLTQMSLLRQPWNEQEKEAGSIAKLIADCLTLERDGDFAWLEHRRHWTTNPSVYPSWLCRSGWPQGTESEGHFGCQLFASDPSLRSAYWGQGEEWVDHIGLQRTGHSY